MAAAAEPVTTEPATIVKKFGGSSVADVERIRAVAEHVVTDHRRGKRVVVVVSAMGRTTDELVRLAHEAAEQPDRRELDMLLTAGERISMSLLAMAIRDRGVPATSLTGSQCGIITNDRQGSARIVEVRPYRVEDALQAGHVVIVAGFQGVSYRREVTTLGRGGSDTTAVALAAALGAVQCEIYSDIDGVYSADPRLDIDARRLAALSYDDMLDLARAGARVLAEQAVAYARDQGVALFVRAADGRPGETMIRRDAPTGPGPVVGVGVREDAALWRYEADAAVLDEVDKLLAGWPEAAVLDGRLRIGGRVTGTLLLARTAGDKGGQGQLELIDAIGDHLGSAVHGTLVSAVLRDAAAKAALARIPGAKATLLSGRTWSALVNPDRAAATARALHA